MSKKRLEVFSELLWQYQGPYLTSLSRAIEPALMALVNGRLLGSDLFPIEAIDSRSLESLPKGCMVEHLTQEQQ